MESSTSTPKKDASVFSFIREGLYEAAYSALNKIGLEVVDKMRETLEIGDGEHPAIDKGHLYDSITAASKPAKTTKYFPASEVRPGNPNMGPVGPRAKAEHVISPETKSLLLKAGTADPKGKYLNYGTSSHKTNLDSKEFVASIIDWCVRHGFDEDFAGYLIKKIRYQGTYAIPFKNVGQEHAENISDTYMKEAISTLIRKIPKVKRYIDKKGIKVEIIK